MPDNTPQTPPEAVKPYVFDTAAFDAKVAAMQSAIKDKAGKPNYNPYMYANGCGFTGLVARYKLGERSKDLFDAMDKVSTTIPPLDPNWKAPEPYKPILPSQLQPPKPK